MARITWVELSRLSQDSTNLLFVRNNSCNIIFFYIIRRWARIYGPYVYFFLSFLRISNQPRA